MEVIVLVPEPYDRTGGSLHLELPEEMGEGPLDDQAGGQAAGGSLDEFFAASQIDPRYIRSKEEIDEYLRAERASWE